jgi:hypothetical protein
MMKTTARKRAKRGGGINLRVLNTAHSLISLSVVTRQRIKYTDLIMLAHNVSFIIGTKIEPLSAQLTNHRIEENATQDQQRTMRRKCKRGEP